jgi:precorrin-6B methylase 2
VSLDEPAEAVMWMVRGTWVAMCLRAACLLGVFDRLDTPLTPGGLAEACHTDTHATTRLLRALTDLGLVARTDDSYVNTALGRTLREDHPGRIRDLALMQSWAPQVVSWTRLADAVRSGHGVFEEVNGASLWASLSAEPEVEQQFNAAMTRRAVGQAAAVLEAVDLSTARTVVDVGGGRGALLAELLRAQPQLSGTVADRSDVAAEATDALAAAGLSDRGHGVAADFFESVPAGADVYVISNVLHDWDDGDCVAILRTVRAAMGPGARLLVVERVLDVSGRSFGAERDLHLLDLHMLVLFGARERTFEQYAAFLVEAGFGPAVLSGAGSDWNVVEVAAD